MSTQTIAEPPPIIYKNVVEELHELARSFMKEYGFNYEGDFPETSDLPEKFNGEERRTDKRSRLYTHYLDADNGNPGLRITFGCHNGQLKWITNTFWVNDGSWSGLSEEEKNVLREQRENHKRLANEKAKRDKAFADELADKALNRFGNAKENPPEGAVTYFSKKGFRNQNLQDKRNIRWESVLDFSEGEKIEKWIALVAMRDGKDNIRALQELWPHKKMWPDGTERDKNFIGKVGGLFFYQGKLENGKDILIGEGVATALSVFQATGKTTVAAMNSGNIHKVVEELHKRYPKSPITICADNDHHREKEGKGNPGLDAAKKAALAHSCKLAIPEFLEGEWFDEEGNPRTDFDDLRRLCENEVVASQINSASTPNKETVNNDEEIIEEDHKEVNRAQPIFRPLTFEEVLNRPKKEWLIDKIFGEKEIGMFFGPPGCGKTFVAIELIMCACRRIKFANRFSVKRELNVAYCAGEGISGLPARFTAAAKHHGINNLSNFTFFETTPQLYEIERNTEASSINSFVYEWSTRQLKGEADPLDILVVDTLHTASIAADENSARDMGKVLASCRFATKELGCTVILIHHSNKAGTAERGSSSMRGAMDFMIEIKKSSDTSRRAEMVCSKLKDGEQWESQPFTLESVQNCGSVRVLWDEPGTLLSLSNLKEDDTKTRLLDEMRVSVGQKLTCRSLAEAVGKDPTYITRLLSELVGEAKCLRSPSNPEAKTSNRNPWVYYVSSNG